MKLTVTQIIKVLAFIIGVSDNERIWSKPYNMLISKPSPVL